MPRPDDTGPREPKEWPPSDFNAKFQKILDAHRRNMEDGEPVKQAYAAVAYKRGWMHAMQAINEIDGFIFDTDMDPVVLNNVVLSLRRQIINHLLADPRFANDQA